MGREVELKIKLTQSEYNDLYQKLYVEKTFQNLIILESSVDSIFKQDEYFSKYKTLEEREKSTEPQVIRIRTEEYQNKKKSYFTIKRKILKNGVEVNKEDETFVENAEVIRELLEEAGYFRWFNKEKIAFSAHCKISEAENLVFHTELVTVNKLPYLEIEVTSEEFDADFISKSLELFVEKLQLDLSKKDERSWYEIISNL